MKSPVLDFSQALLKLCENHQASQASQASQTSLLCLFSGFSCKCNLSCAHIFGEGVARDLQELSEYRRMERFRNVLQEHMMNDAHRYAFHRGLPRQITG